MGLRFNQLLRAMGGGLPPVTLTFTDTQASFGYMGFFDTTSVAGRRIYDRPSAPAITAGVWFGVIKGSSATMTAAAGDTSPYLVSVDGGAETTPTLSAGRITLFSGLADTQHTVSIRSDNSEAGQSVPTTGELFGVTGSAPAISAVGVQRFIKDPTFPGLETFAQNAAKGGNWLPAYPRAITNPGGGVSGGSIHMRVKAADVWVFCALTEVWTSVDSGAYTKNTLVANSTTPGGVACSWKKIAALSGDVSAEREIIIVASATSSYNLSGQIEGVMVTGAGASIAAPSTSKTVVTMCGASQVEGAGATIGSVDIHRLQVPIPTLASAQIGAGGATIAAINTALSSWAPKLKAANRQTILLSVGINSADDAAFQTDYQSLISTCLAQGFTKVICRGLLQTVSNTSKNAKIAAAVVAAADARVIFADVSTWTAATTDTGSPVVVMPDGSHPNDLGYDRMATLVVRDHSALLP